MIRYIKESNRDLLDLIFRIEFTCGSKRYHLICDNLKQALNNLDFEDYEGMNWPKVYDKNIGQVSIIEEEKDEDFDDFSYLCCELNFTISIYKEEFENLDVYLEEFLEYVYETIDNKKIFYSNYGEEGYKISLVKTEDSCDHDFEEDDWGF